jgi:aryl-alcohol dehydrogenase-like predicted oxidoreductase
MLDSALGLGTAPMGSRPDWQLWWGAVDPDEAVATVRAALDARVTWIDTAPFYGWGQAEELVGRAVRGRREEVRILTKCGTVPDGQGRAREDGSPEQVRADLEASLVRLGTDHVDVLQLHDPDPSVPIEDTWGAIHQLVAEGKTLAGGLSNHSVELLDRADAVAPVAVVQAQLSVLVRDVEQDGTLAWCRARGIPFLAWSPLASGCLVDGFDPDALDADDFRRRLQWTTPPLRDHVDRLRAALTAAGTSFGRSGRDMALGWVLAHEGVHAIIGATTPTQAGAMGSPPLLTAAEVAAVDAAIAESGVADAAL